MRIFKSLQTSVPEGCNGMTQYVNESFQVVQLDKFGNYLGPQEVAVTFENEHISRALRARSLRVVEFFSEEEKVEAKSTKKSKKLDFEHQQVDDEIQVPEVVETVADSAVEEDSSVVAIEPIEI
jgi:hypothetical protein